MDHEAALDTARAHPESIPAKRCLLGQKRGSTTRGKFQRRGPRRSASVAARFDTPRNPIASDGRWRQYGVANYEIPRRRVAIGGYAESLLIAYLPRLSFLDAVNYRELSKAFAGKTWLGLSRQRSAEVYQECPAAPALAERFRADVLVGMKDGKIPWGHETYDSTLADEFYIALAGSEAKFDRWYDCFGDDCRIVIDDTPYAEPSDSYTLVTRQITNYLAFCLFKAPKPRRRRRAS